MKVELVPLVMRNLMRLWLNVRKVLDRLDIVIVVSNALLLLLYVLYSYGETFLDFLGGVYLRVFSSFFMGAVCG